MTQAEILEEVTEVVRDVLAEDDVVLSAGSTAADVEGWDSVTNIEIMIGLEQSFGFRFQTGEMATIKNVGELVARIEQKLAG